MTSRQFQRLCATPIPKAAAPPPPPPPPPAPVRTKVRQPETTLHHPERLKDPRWQMKPWRKGGFIDFLRRNGSLNEARLNAHFADCASRSHPGTTDNAVTASLATGVGPSTVVRCTPKTPPSLVSQPQSPG